MPRRSSKHLIGTVALAILIGIGFFACRFAYVWWHIPEAYAAWDAGVLLVRYMETHDNEWPSGWSELEQSYADEPQLRLRWNPHEPDYFLRMKEMVAIDWDYDTNERNPKNPVTRPDGTLLVCLWADPNYMVNRHLDGDGPPINGW